MTANIKPTEEDFLDPAQWMSTQEFADILGVKVQAVWNRISTGEDMPESYRFSKRLTRFYRPEVKAWILARQRVTAGAIQRIRREAAQARA
ncbi:MAG: hypothetical protein H7A18_03240 [Sinobacteraceae bacterium]|nr:hypothetical protein [Nevskiaceae bacterium]